MLNNGAPAVYRNDATNISYKIATPRVGSVVITVKKHPQL
jgi:hypothetical protein